jgi:hypothetical protein
MRRKPAQDNNVKRAPNNFDDDDDNIGDVEENAHQRQGRQANGGNY